MSSGYWPANDDQFSAWMAKFSAYLGVNYAKFGLTTSDSNPVSDVLLPDWTAALTAHKNAQAAALAATAAKKEARKALEVAVRSLAGRINSHTATTDADRAELGLRAAAPATSDPEMGDARPLPIIDISNRLKHTIRVNTVTSTGARRARPAGVIGCELWRKIGDAPAGVQDMELVGMVQKTPFVIEYTDADAGKMAHYAMRWVDSHLQLGAWSETESATIAA